MTLADLQMHYPDIPWTEPLKIAAAVEHPMDSSGKLAIIIDHTEPPSGWRYACRVCIANNGLTAEEVRTLPTDPDLVREHVRKVHAS